MGICIGKLENNNNQNNQNNNKDLKMISNSNFNLHNFLKRRSTFTITKLFNQYNILNYSKCIILGTWNNPNKTSNLHNQGIWIEGHKKIYALLCGLICANTVVLNFEDGIKLYINKKKIIQILRIF